ncbi:hypothetical protein OV079_51360 [Nannocystis pusilla]|uniref:OmpA-like domain-containing protein n=1 Tax=Nannocystis pusilla TaxID=889268 RepID=A0A9X3F9D0_9BACT|nr:hypothetical protein [Nannocystis pusilla]MCY1013791.1 hypothetical protein [Nannocystis pusilla]
MTSAPAGPGGVRAVFDVGAGELILGHTDLRWSACVEAPERRRGQRADHAVVRCADQRAIAIPPAGRRSQHRGQHRDPAEHRAGRPDRARRRLCDLPAAGGRPDRHRPGDRRDDRRRHLRNVLHLRGPRALLATVTLQLRSGTADWRLGTGGADDPQRVSSFALPLLAEGRPTTDLVATNDDGTRRVRIDVVPTGPLAVGHQSTTDNNSPAQVTVVGTGPATPTAVVDTFLASPFHADADWPAAPNLATLAGTDVTVPQGADAEVEVPVPTGANDPPPQPQVANETPRVVQVQYEWDQTVPIRVLYPYAGTSTAGEGLHEPDARPLALEFTGRARLQGSNVQQQLTSWIAALGTPHGRKFYVLGRTDDLKLAGTKSENDTYNNTLATQRANAARNALVAAGVSATDITVAIESAGFASPPEGSPPARLVGARRLALPWPQSPAFAAGATPVEPQVEPGQHHRSQRRDQRPQPPAIPLRRDLRGRHHRAAAPGPVIPGPGADPAARARPRRRAGPRSPDDHHPAAAHRLPRAPAREVGQPDGGQPRRRHPDRGRGAGRLEGRGGRAAVERGAAAAADRARLLGDPAALGLRRAQRPDRGQRRPQPA